MACELLLNINHATTAQTRKNAFISPTSLNMEHIGTTVSVDGHSTVAVTVQANILQ